MKNKYALQSRYMLMSLAEAYKLYCQDHPNEVGLSKFCDLRPKHIKVFDKLPQTLCVGMYHENFRLLLQVLSAYTQLPKYVSDFTDNLVCNPSSKTCMSLECTECRDKIREYQPQLDVKNVNITYYQWQTCDRTEKVQIAGTVQEAYDEQNLQLKQFLIHVFIKRQQADYFNKVKSEVDGTKVVLQVDFSENASLLTQNEIQSAHWNHAQATLFTAYAWVDKNLDESIVLVSDDLEHNKVSVYSYMSYILEYLTSKYPRVREIKVISDGAASQFKQRFLFSNLYVRKDLFSVDLEWNFFATSHGKGVVDGICGTVKRSVWWQVRAGKENVTSALKFSEIAIHRNPGIHIKYIPSDSIKTQTLEITSRWQKTKVVPNTHKIHCIKPFDSNFVFFSETSNSKF